MMSFYTIILFIHFKVLPMIFSKNVILRGSIKNTIRLRILLANETSGTLHYYILSLWCHIYATEYLPPAITFVI